MKYMNIKHKSHHLEDRVEEFLNKATPSKKFAAKLAFELEEMENSLLATVLGDSHKYSLAKKAVQNYIDNYSDDDIADNFSVEDKTELMEARDKAEDLLNKARHCYDDAFSKEVKAYFEEMLTDSDCRYIREIALPCVERATDWGFSVAQNIIFFLADINRRLKLGDGYEMEEVEEEEED